MTDSKNKAIQWLEWKDEDFVFEKMKFDEWKIYEKKYPNMSWGTCIIDRSKDKDTVLVRRFINKETCRKYCTAPVSFDFNGGL